MDVGVVFPPVNRGCVLPSDTGFSFKMTKPSISMKTYDAMCEVGLRDEADRVLETYRESHITPDLVWAEVLKFAGVCVPKTSQLSYENALKSLETEFKIQDKIRPITMEEASLKLPRTTSPGLPYIQSHPGQKTRQILKHNFRKFSKYWDRVANKMPVSPLPDCAAFAKTHITKSDENKVLSDWAFPLHMILLESTFSVPLLYKILTQECFTHTAYGMEILKGGMTWLNIQLERAQKRGANKFLKLYFSAFDAAIPAWIIRDVFKIIKSKFILSKKESICFNKMINYFINTPIRNMDGGRFQKDHGIPSGSTFTDIVGCCITYVMLLTVLPLVVGCEPDFINVFGDDSITAIPKKGIINIEDISTCFKNIFGVSINVKKSYWTNNICNAHYLGYYNYNGQPIKETSELLFSMLYPQQYLKDDWAYCIARALCCALAGCGNSVVFRAAKSVYLNGICEKSENSTRGLKLLYTDPRIMHHLSVMGCSDWNFDEKIFYQIDNFFPRLNCTKLEKDINM